MFFSKKKIQRDRAAGLVFRWRGGHATNRGGGTLALCLTAAIFAGGFLLLNVSATPGTVPSRYRASVIQLVNIDDRLSWWIERNSPSMPQWSVESDEESVRRVDDLLLGEINATKHRGMGYQDIDIQKIERVEDDILSLNSDTLPSIARHVSSNEDDPSNVPLGKVRWSLEIAAENGLKKRWPENVVYEKSIPDSWRGSVVKFSVVVDSSGRALAVNPIEWSENPTVKEFQEWLYAVAFEPAEKQDISIGVVEFRSVSQIEFEVPKSENESVKEEQP